MPRLQTLILLYTDPGTGTLIWQLILAALFGGLFYSAAASCVWKCL